MRAGNAETARRPWLWGAVGLGLWAASTLAVVALYDRFVRAEPPPPQVVKHIHERPVIRVESAGAEAREAVLADSATVEAPLAAAAPEEQARENHDDGDPAVREDRRRARFDQVLQEFEAQPPSGAERPRAAALQSAIDRGLAELPAAEGVRRGDVVCRGAACSMSVSFHPDVDFPSFNAALKQATSTDALKDEVSGKRPLRSLHTYTDGDQVVGKFYFRWPER
ncbi:MAG TPA: hypothetical protein VI197_29660 [Polyangiaceae bacterium]